MAAMTATALTLAVAPSNAVDKDCADLDGGTVDVRLASNGGTRVVLVSDPAQVLRNRYDRLLRYVVRARDTVDLNRRQIANCMARVFVHNSDPFKRPGSCRTARDNARSANRGLWATCW